MFARNHSGELNPVNLCMGDLGRLCMPARSTIITALSHYTTYGIARTDNGHSIKLLDTQVHQCLHNIDLDRRMAKTG